jgi:gamma-glutamylcyclotransferase (GGCT)/AIG2-like uncharacterized protein YtfP
VTEIFVYGTLMAGRAAAGLLGAGERRAATLRGDLFRMPAGYPAVKLGGMRVVHGELVAVPDPRVFSVLDQYEGVGEGQFRRIRADVVVGLRTLDAWVYVMENPHLRGGLPLPEGRWKGRVRS